MSSYFDIYTELHALPHRCKCAYCLATFIYRLGDILSIFTICPALS